MPMNLFPGLQGGQGGQGGLADPRLLGLLGAGGALMGASQPSRVPVGLGQAMSGAMQGGLGGFAMGNMMNRQAKRDNILEEILRREAGLAGRGEGGGMQGGGQQGLAGMLPMLGGLY